MNCNSLLTGLIFLSITLTTSAQSFVSVHYFPGQANNYATNMVNDVFGNVYLTGYFEGSVDINPYVPSDFHTSQGLKDIYLIKLDPYGNYLWGFSLGSNLWEETHALLTDSAGNVFVGGYFADTVDFDPGAGVVNQISYPVGSTNAFMAKYLANGTLDWVKILKGTNANAASEIRHMKMDQAGNICMSGILIGTCDFDPGVGTSTLSQTPANGYDLFIAKYTQQGDYIWAKGIHSNNNGGLASPNSMLLDGTNNIYVVGEMSLYSSSFFDFDPGPGTNLITDAGGSDGFIAKYDPNGNLIFTGQIGGTQSDMITDFEMDSNGDLILIGAFTTTADLDPLATVLNFTVPVNGFFIEKISAVNGSLLWAKIAGPPGFLYPFDLKLGVNDEINMISHFSGSVDVDVDTSSNFLVSAGSYDIGVCMYDADAHFISSQSYGGPGFDSGRELLFDPIANSWRCIGYFSDSVDFDNSSGVYQLNALNGRDGFLLNITSVPCDSMITKISNLTNITCASPLGTATLSVTGFVPPLSITWNGGAPGTSLTDTFNIPGVFPVHVQDSVGCYDDIWVIIDQPAFPNDFDLRGNFGSLKYRPGQLTPVFLDVFNDGCVNASGTVKLILDPLVLYHSPLAFDFPDQISGDTLIWNFDPMNSDSAHLQSLLFLYTSLSANIGDIIDIKLMILPVTGDTIPVNNIEDYQYNVVNSYDPNIKDVYPQGDSTIGAILNNQLMKYCVHFQNTGTADAINIYILDTLDSNLDINSLRITGSSHTMIPELLPPGNVLRFRFDNIMLPDSGSNQAGSHGFVMYEIEQVSSLSHLTEIRNTAYIYFDNNPPIITNTTLNTIWMPTDKTEIKEAVNGNGFWLYPNPTYSVIHVVNKNKSPIESYELRDISGKLILKKTEINSFSFTIEMGNYFENGIYLLNCVDSEGTQQTLKFILNK